MGNPYDDVSAVGYFTANGGKILAVKRPPYPPKTLAHGFPETRVPYRSMTIGYPHMDFNKQIRNSEQNNPDLSSEELGENASIYRILNIS